MNVIFSILLLALLAMEIVLAIPILYLLLLTVAATFAPRRSNLPTNPKTHFAILIPAHNEERLLPELLASLYALDYLRVMYDVYVVADNCTDRTADIARNMALEQDAAPVGCPSSAVFERFDTRQIGKGYALNWLLQQVRSARPAAAPVDAYVIFDADTIVSPNFLRVMDARLQAGENAIQGYYAVRNPTQSWGVALRYAALAVLHFLRPLGRCALGGTAGLKGNGMCFRASLYEQLPWSGSLTEDIEYHTALVRFGERVTFAPDAVLEAEMPGNLSAAQTQNVRWESGRFEMARAAVPGLLKQALQGRRFAPLDAAMEHLIPPTVILAVLIGMCLLAGIGLAWLGSSSVALSGANGSSAVILVWGAVGLLAGLIIYLAAGLIMVKAPGRVWLALLYAPFYMIWKIALLIRVVFNRRPQKWVRTER